MTKTYAQLTREIQALQAHAEKLRAVELKAVIVKLNETIAKHGLRAEDLRFAGTGSSSGGSVRSARQAVSASRSTTTSSGAKYGDSQGNSWGGRGPRPAWLRDALSKGRSLESFALSGIEPSNPASATQGRSNGKGNANEKSTAVKSPLPPLYSHPKTGQTWSGRGPKPAWLKQGLKKRGVSLNDFLISSRQSGEGQPDAAASASFTSSSAAQGSPKAKSAAAPRGAAAPKKSLAEKISSRTTSSSAASVKPDTAPAPAASTPAVTAKKTASKKAPAKKSSTASNAPTRAKTAAKTAAKKSATSSASEPAETSPPAKPATPAAPAKKAASKTPAKTAAKSPKKPSAKKTGPANKRIASSMAPPADTPPASSDAAATPLPGQESAPVEGQEAAPGV